MHDLITYKNRKFSWLKTGNFVDLLAARARQFFFSKWKNIEKKFFVQVHNPVDIKFLN